MLRDEVQGMLARNGTYQKEVHIQSTNVRQIKAALWDQAFRGCTRVSCPMGGVVAIRTRQGQLQAMIRGWGRCYTVERVTIDIKFALPDRRASQWQHMDGNEKWNDMAVR